MSYLHNYLRRLRIWETHYGRDGGWMVERQHKVVAVLTEPRWEDMFWDSYRIEIIAQDPELQEQILTKEFWIGEGLADLVWRSREFGEVAEPAVTASSPFPESGRLMLRGLYLPIREPWPWDWLVLWVRRQLHQGRGRSTR